MMTDTPLRILYQDDTLIAIEKPCGLLVHRSPIDKHETRFAVQMLRDQIGQHVFPVHRLDRPTSGVLLFAFSGQIASEVGQQMMARTVQKEYAAIVRGHIHADGMVDYALKFKADKIADKDRGAIPPQPACTFYTPVQRFVLPFQSGRYSSSRYTYVKLFPHSGRKHQLRRHMVHLRNPIIGDTTHGDGKQNKFMRQQFNFTNLALTCTRLGVQHPLSGKWLDIHCPVHDAMHKLLACWEEFKVN
ncbi:pseudouridine synthase [Salinimonas lutimaris]|uniref:pseudouridine synthase n=1 Tax=Salinimonas lutimaris TaxID=914153 RepID=UPI0015861360|nr:pseudouridine synthase [Salinimonas lutimaris]